MSETHNPKKAYQRLRAENIERLKELSAINQTTRILKEKKPLAEMLQQICMIIPAAWQYPEFTVARINLDDREYKTPEFIETSWVQRQPFETIDNKKGAIEVFIPGNSRTWMKAPSFMRKGT